MGWHLLENGHSTLAQAPPPAHHQPPAPTRRPTASAQCQGRQCAVGLGRIGSLLLVWLGVLSVLLEPMATGLRLCARRVLLERLLRLLVLVCARRVHLGWHQTLEELFATLLLLVLKLLLASTTTPLQPPTLPVPQATHALEELLHLWRVVRLRTAAILQLILALFVQLESPRHPPAVPQQMPSAQIAWLVPHTRQSLTQEHATPAPPVLLASILPQHAPRPLTQAHATPAPSVLLASILPQHAPRPLTQCVNPAQLVHIVVLG
jgi:hypothetical protein